MCPYLRRGDPYAVHRKDGDAGRSWLPRGKLARAAWLPPLRPVILPAAARQGVLSRFLVLSACSASHRVPLTTALKGHRVFLSPFSKPLAPSPGKRRSHGSVDSSLVTSGGRSFRGRTSSPSPCVTSRHGSSHRFSSYLVTFSLPLSLSPSLSLALALRWPLLLHTDDDPCGGSRKGCASERVHRWRERRTWPSR